MPPPCELYLFRRLDFHVDIWVEVHAICEYSYNIVFVKCDLGHKATDLCTLGMQQLTRNFPIGLSLLEQRERSGAASGMGVNPLAYRNGPILIVGSLPEKRGRGNSNSALDNHRVSKNYQYAKRTVKGKAHNFVLRTAVACAWIYS